MYSGTIENRVAHHYPVFHVLKLGAQKSKHEKHTINYDFCKSNQISFVNDIDVELRHRPPKTFGAFVSTVNESIDKTCKLENPKVSKRNIINNPWITPGLIAASKTKHSLHDAWKKTCCKLKPLGNESMHEKFTNYRRTLKHLIKKAVKSYYGN